MRSIRFSFSLGNKEKKELRLFQCFINHDCYYIVVVAVFVVVVAVFVVIVVVFIVIVVVSLVAVVFVVVVFVVAVVAVVVVFFSKTHRKITP